MDQNEVPEFNISNVPFKEGPRFFSKRNILAFLVVAILLISIPFGVKLVQERQNTKSKASSADAITFTGPNVDCTSNPSQCTTTSSTVQLQLVSPLGPPQPQ